MPGVVAPSGTVTILFCEGRPQSLDDLLLNNLIPGSQVLVKPVGGKYGMKAFIDGYLGSYAGDEPNYIGFRDRDFDVEPPQSPELVRWHGTKPIWMSYRAAIENYFIEADLIHRYWVEREQTPTWSHGPALPVDKIEAHIEATARELVDYQAVRWGLARLKPGARWPDVNTTWTAGSGKLPSSLNYDDCLAEAHELVETFQRQIQPIEPAQLQAYAEAYRQQFSQDDFFAERRYLAWFHGKDHLALLCSRLVSNFPRRHYERWAAENVNSTKHPDLQQLIRLTEVD